MVQAAGGHSRSETWPVAGSPEVGLGVGNVRVGGEGVESCETAGRTRGGEAGSAAAGGARKTAARGQEEEALALAEGCVPGLGWRVMWPQYAARMDSCRVVQPSRRKTPTRRPVSSAGRATRMSTAFGERANGATTLASLAQMQTTGSSGGWTSGNQCVLNCVSISCVLNLSNFV